MGLEHHSGFFIKHIFHSAKIIISARLPLGNYTPSKGSFHNYFVAVYVILISCNLSSLMSAKNKLTYLHTLHQMTASGRSSATLHCKVQTPHPLLLRAKMNKKSSHKCRSKEIVFPISNSASKQPRIRNFSAQNNQPRIIRQRH